MTNEMKESALALPEQIKEVLIEITDLEYNLESYKEVLIQEEVRVDNDTRISLQEAGTKVTEKIIENAVIVNQGIIDIKTSITDTKKKIGYTKADLECLRTIKEMIVALAKCEVGNE